MSRTETLLGLLAVVLASVSALPIPYRIYFAGAAILILAYLGTMRIRAAFTQKRETPAFDKGERAARIREERDRRMGG